ncbi:alanine racemase [Bifidobacterium sp. BRDM6]|uniref:Alanine racemase n=2 Tax=Bifidobacterium choloepi TaxID=2614131 RepID=A0A6I5N012_9BIFI|nr:alanine racemase [Bifidobacterium choloepi]NEG69445.1 alanine racemase [Bifidobacterium choloepi]
MTLSAAPQWSFSSDQGNANYRDARRRYPAQAVIDMRALRDNMRRLVAMANQPAAGQGKAGRQANGHRTEVMGVVKADAYGHGLVPTALAALAGGATWLGTAQAREALLLRHAGIGVDRARILTWVNNPLEVAYDELIANDIDISVGTATAMEKVAAAAKAVGKPARVHVKVDTGFGRNGFTPAQAEEAFARLGDLADEGLLDVVGQWSHLAVADAPDIPEFVEETDHQIALFERFTRQMTNAGIPPKIRHLANTAATLSRPAIHYDLVRPGVGLYGYEADPAMGTPADFKLVPAMTLQAQLSSVKDMLPGMGLSYGRVYLTEELTSTAIVPVGYADGIHRSASGFDLSGSRHTSKPGGPVRVMTNDGPKLFRVSGRVCMDQFIIDLHGSAAELGVGVGDTVVLFGPGRGEAYAEPTADDWARAADTISYEIFTCLRNRVPRLYLNAPEVLSESDLALLDPASIL